MNINNYSRGGVNRKPLYPGNGKTSTSGIATHYTGQKEIRDRRNPPNKYKAKPSSKLSKVRGFDPDEEVKGTSMHKRLQISDCDNTDLEAMRRRIEILEQENQEKDRTISKLKAENGQLRAQKNVLYGKLKRKDTEEAKEKRYNQPNKSAASRAPVSAAWDPTAKKMSGKLYCHFHLANNQI